MLVEKFEPRYESAGAIYGYEEIKVQFFGRGSHVVDENLHHLPTILAFQDNNAFYCNPSHLTTRTQPRSIQEKLMRYLDANLSNNMLYIDR